MTSLPASTERRAFTERLVDPAGHRSEIRRLAHPDGFAPPNGSEAPSEPWWLTSLRVLEERETEARDRLIAARAELRDARRVTERLTATVAVRDGSLKDACAERDELRAQLDAALARLSASEAEVARGRAHYAEMSASIAELTALAADRDATVERAEATEARLRATTGSLRSRTAELARATKELEELREKQVVLVRRSKQLHELRHSRSYRLLQIVWKIKGAVAWPYRKLAAAVRG